VGLTLEIGRVSDYVLTLRSARGGRVPVAINAVVVQGSGSNEPEIVASARDVTDQQELERQLRDIQRELELKNVELARANRTKDRFLASMSHELRTPLNAIIGFTSVLLTGMPGPLNEEQGSQLRIVQSSSRHLLSIISDLLDLAKIEEGRWEGDFRPGACQAIAEEVTSSLGPLVRDTPTQLRLVAPRRPITAVTDRRALSQILINLVSNAIKFTDRGEVRLEVHERRRDGDRQVAFDVVDSGVGIRKEDRVRLFAAFERVQDPSAPREGTGLGLHISQRLATQLNGSITFKSRPGRGSTFTLTLPQAAQG
jgi:signal transduction histidine kinase